MPYWLKVFPELKVIHIVRHPLNVAASLRHRELAHQVQMQQMQHKEPEMALAGGIKLQLSPRCFAIEQGIALWREHVNSGLKIESMLSDDQYQYIRYEEFLNSPEDHLNKLASFCGLPINEGIVASLTKNIDSSRAYAYRHDEELVNLNIRTQTSDLLAQLGYQEE